VRERARESERVSDRQWETERARASNKGLRPWLCRGGGGG